MLPQRLQYRVCLKPEGTFNTKLLHIVQMHILSLVVIEDIYEHSHIDVQYKEDVRLALELSASACLFSILVSSVK